ncbi:MAG: hypothetical protein V3T30_06410 [Thermodesulfobacteriota bacterium]
MVLSAYPLYIKGSPRIFKSTRSSNKKVSVDAEKITTKVKKFFINKSLIGYIDNGPSLDYPLLMAKTKKSKATRLLILTGVVVNIVVFVLLLTLYFL